MPLDLAAAAGVIASATRQSPHSTSSAEKLARSPEARDEGQRSGAVHGCAPTAAKVEVVDEQVVSVQAGDESRRRGLVEPAQMRIARQLSRADRFEELLSETQFLVSRKDDVSSIAFLRTL